MKPFLGFLLLLINILASSTDASNIIIAFIQLCIILKFIAVSKKQGNSFLVALIELLCYSWSSSWRNIFGGDFADIPLPWFYLIGLLIVLYIIFCKKFSINKSIFIIMLLIIVGLIPLFKSSYFYDAISQYITFLFFYVVVGTISSANITISENELFNILKSFVYAILFSSIGIISQFLMQSYTGFDFVNNVQTEFLGGRRMISSLLFKDISSATICLGLGVIIVILDMKKFKHPYIISLCIIAGMVLSSARTGFITLFITLAIYIITAKKNIKNKGKTVFIIVFAGIVGGMAYYAVRGISNISQLLDDNGRFTGYKKALEIWSMNPIFGIGFSDTYLSQLMQLPIPHLSLLNIMTQAGVIYTLLLTLLIIYFYNLSLHSKYRYGKYMLIHSVIGSLFVPGLLSARFLTIVIIVIILQEKTISCCEVRKELEEEGIINNDNCMPNIKL